MSEDMTYGEAIAYAKTVDEDRKLIKAIRYPIETMTIQEIKNAMFMATDDLLSGDVTVTEFNEIGKRCRKRMKTIASLQKLASAAIVVVATVLLMTPTMADGGLGLRMKEGIEQRLMELDARPGNRRVLCFELGDSSSKTYEPAKCTRGDTGDFGPYRCVFDDGQTTQCSTHDNGCFVCSGID